ncbi:MAG TPA: permease-like cell division protein FtsX [Candidatus Paceibacterota bacterium]|nr:permease-like cell division protein FtsX [Candidatus Paceibacterota bacterium]
MQHLWLSAKRIGRYGLIGFFRNGFVTLAAILIMTITLAVIGTMMVTGAALSATLSTLSDNVDISVYFTPDAPEDRIMQVKSALEALPEVANVTYTTRDQALEQFKARHQNDQLTLQALDELADNPLGASLSIQAKDTSEYQAIDTFLQTAPGVGEGSDSIIDKVNFAQNKTAIERLSNIIATARTAAIAIAIIFAIASILIAFNTIRLAIYTSREEIGVMRLVGAGSWYVRGPFVVAGVLYGIIAAILVLVLMYPVTFYLGGPSERFFGTFNTFTYYMHAFPLIFSIILGTGIVLGALSSFLAVRRYLR